MHMHLYTVPLGYCDSDVTVGLLFWNMPIIQDRDVKFPLLFTSCFMLKAIVSQWLNRSTTVGVLVWKTRRRNFRILACFFFLSVYVWKCAEGFVHFLHIVANSPSLFPK